MSGKRILVVDDDPGIVHLIVTMLEKEGYHLVAAHTGQDALQIIEDQHPDLMLLDLAMPGFSGVEVLEEVRRREQDAGAERLPVLLLTAHAQSYFLSQQSALDADGSISKPVSKRKLINDLSHFFS